MHLQPPPCKNTLQLLLSPCLLVTPVTIRTHPHRTHITHTAQLSNVSQFPHTQLNHYSDTLQLVPRALYSTARSYKRRAHVTPPILPQFCPSPVYKAFLVPCGLHPSFLWIHIPHFGRYRFLQHRHCTARHPSTPDSMSRAPYNNSQLTNKATSESVQHLYPMPTETCVSRCHAQIALVAVCTSDDTYRYEEPTMFS